jgi:hypothetical protein
MDSPEWIWSDPDGGGRNAFALFRRVLDLPERPALAELRLFADARWRLRINDLVVGYGPGRFMPAFPEYDTLDIVPWLSPGRNVIVVEAWAPNASSFHMAESSGGFIAWGEVRCADATLDLATPGSWQSRAAEAWDADAPLFSFAQGPAEIVDLAKLPRRWFTAADADGWRRPSLRAEARWGELRPRSTPPLDHRAQRPGRLALVAALDDSEERVAYRSCLPGLKERSRRSPQERFHLPYAVVIRSPREQTVELGLFWGPHWLNGVQLEMQRDPLRGNRENATARLGAGDNVLYGEPQALADVWGQYVAVPRAAGLELGPIRSTAPMRGEELAAARGPVPAVASDLDRLPWKWSEARPAAYGPLPARDMAWDRPARVIARDAAAVFPLVLDAARDPAGWVVVCDFTAQFNGHAIIDIDAPAGTVVDIGVDERLRADGLIPPYLTNPFIDNVERARLADGRQQVELFQPRGGRYLQLAIRPPSGAGQITLHGIAVRGHQITLARDGTFACADPLLEWAWETSRDSLQAVLEEVILADSWRERALYSYDHLVQATSFACFSRDLRPAKRGLRLWAQGRCPDGKITGWVPGWGRTGDIGANLYWVRTLHHLWTRDGDLAEAARWWPVVEESLAGPGQTGTIAPMWDLREWIFIDWGAEKADYGEQANGVLNAWRYSALRCGSELATALGRDAQAKRWAAEAEAVAAAYRERLWIAEERRFARCLVDGRPDRQGMAMHANAMALAAGLASPDQTPGVLAWLERGLAGNAELAMAGGANGSLELFFLHWALEALYEHGRSAFAEARIRDHYAPMHARHAVTIWETLGRGVRDSGNLCQGWGTTVVRWCHERILGVRPERAGDLSQLLIAPDSALEWAEGEVPHPRGTVRISWRRVGDRLEISARAPDGVSLRVAPGPCFAGLRVVADLGTAAEGAAPAAARTMRSSA